MAYGRPAHPSTASSLSLHDLQCKLCDCIVDRPVKTPCNNLVCAKCISSLVLNAESSLQCPCCEERHDLSPTLFVPASDVVLKVLGALLICCDKSSCTAVMSLKHLAEHVKSGTHHILFTIQAHNEADSLPSAPVTSNCS